MMPKTSVRPAASRNSSMPSCTPLRHCSMKYSIRRRDARLGVASPQARRRKGARRQDDRSGPVRQPRTAPLFHRAAVVKAVLVVLDNGRDGVEDVVALSVLHHVLQIEILDRDVVVAELEVAAHGLEVGLLHLLAHL